MDTHLIIIIIAQFLGLISWILLLYSYTREDIDELVYVQIGVYSFNFVSYLMLGAYSAFLICLVELIKSILYYKTDKERLVFRYSIVAYLLIGFLTLHHWYACLPVIGSILDSYGSSRDSKTANICSIITNALWTFYDILILSYVGAVNDVIVVICNISVLTLGYSRLMHISKFRIIKYNYLNKKTIDKIYDLDIKNYTEKNTWDKDYRLKVYNKNKDSFFAVKYKHDFIGYINYLNLDLSEFERLKKIRKIPYKIDVDKILEFKSNRKSYLVLENINVRKEYEREQTINLICKKFASFVKQKHRKRIYIHGIIGFSFTDFESDVYLSLGFRKIRRIDDKVTLYELNEEEIKEYYLK